MTGRRMKGEGGVTLRADGRWMGTVELGWGPDGKRRRRTLYGRTQREVVVKLAAERRSVAEHGADLAHTTTVTVYLTRWVEEIAAPRLKPKSLVSYRSVVRAHLIPRLGRYRLDKLAPQHVRAMDRAIEADVSPMTALKVHAVLSKALTDAVREGIVARNVAELVDRPLRSAGTRGAFTVPDAVELLRTTWDDRLGGRWAAAILTGARQGELLGLEIDRVGDVVDLSWQLQRLPYKHGCATPCGHRFAGDCPARALDVRPTFEHRVLDGSMALIRPKSRSGWRVIPLVEPLRTILLARIAASASEPNPYGLVWTRRTEKADNGLWIDPGDDRAAWRDALARAGLAPALLHSARHTTATMLHALGVDEGTRMKILGHAAIATTRGYEHDDDTLMRDAAARLGALLTPARIEG
jgi:integrase